MDKAVLRKAITDGPDPTPGYLFRDITQMTFADQATQEKLVAYLMEKLNVKSSVHILAKTLKIIKVLCETGHTDFQKEMQRNADFLKNFAQFRGTSDVKFGDAYNERVRQNAKEAIDAAFSPRKEAKMQVAVGHGSEATEDAGAKKGGFLTGTSLSTTPGASATSAPMPTRNLYAETLAAREGQSKTTAAFGAVKGMVTSGFGLWKEGIKTDEQRYQEGAGNVGEFRAVELPNDGFGGGGFNASAGGASSSGGGGGGPGGSPRRAARVVPARCQR
jgi:hypothetical protein